MHILLLWCIFKSMWSKKVLVFWNTTMDFWRKISCAGAGNLRWWRVGEALMAVSTSGRACWLCWFILFTFIRHWRAYTLSIFGRRKWQPDQTCITCPGGKTTRELARREPAPAFGVVWPSIQGLERERAQDKNQRKKFSWLTQPPNYPLELPLREISRLI